MTEQFRPPAHIGEALQIVRDRRRVAGEIVVAPRAVRCLHCGKFHKVEDMPTIPHTGVVGPVMDCLCKTCKRENLKDLSKVTRIVCAGCREVVAVVEPGKEKSGFVWRAGKCVHVYECPACTSKSGLTQSPIAEKIMFYKKNGIPYA